MLIYLLIFIIILVLLSYFPKKVIEGYYQNDYNPNTTYYYNFSLSDKLLKDRCQLTGLIEDYESPNPDLCYFGYYVPSTLNFKFYPEQSFHDK